MKEIVFKPIGVIHSEFKSPEGTPIQPSAASGAAGQVELFEEFKRGLKDLDGFSHIILLYYFHMVKGEALTGRPFMGDEDRGIFAIRGPSRPNAIGISTVRLLSVSDNILKVRDVDILEGTPLLDIKPYVPGFDNREKVRIGWLDRKIHRLKDTTDDGRFSL
ncbi:MAG TPA: tRNA (N6-threonylcarbamoyladenosine(37)-N6)-methyltransferase TrmO [Candidatus Krumholzibacteriaceae bacterium]|nr:tRNA (N6-threonylcarbamoyladenosine(37)-N6)-methyltransferase TrmO [Candidatus Krumholzibacteriaceae bacterium]